MPPGIRHLFKMSSLPASLRLTALLLTAAASAQGRYSAHSFEAPEFRVGQLAGHDMFTGQDGWLITTPSTFANLAAIRVQNSVVRSGARACVIDAATIGNIDYGHLRTNQQFNVQGVLEAEVDLRLGSGTRPSGSWDLQIQVAPIPASTLVWWSIRPDGELWFTRGQIGVSLTWQRTGVRLARDQWYHTRTVVDVTNNTTELWVDGVAIVTGVPPIATVALPGHGFTSLIVNQPGDDRLYFDNFTVRDRGREPALAVDLDRVSVGAPAQVELRLAASSALASRSYVLLASMSGTQPGTTLRPGVVLPLNVDSFTLAAAAGLNGPVFQSFAGVLSQHGTAQALFASQIPVPVALAGTTIHFAYAVSPSLTHASEAAAVVLR
jgi:hypothetical protein